MSRALRPLFVNVTWGAGGSTAAKSLELAEICQRQLGLTTCLHLTCTNMSKLLVVEAFDEAKALGIRNILALRGECFGYPVLLPRQGLRQQVTCSYSCRSSASMSLVPIAVDISLPIQGISQLYCHRLPTLR